MTYQVPNFDEQAFTEIARKHYGLEGEISSFVSYEDQNALIKTPKGKFVIKIANKRWDLEFVRMQTEVLEYLKNAAPNMTFPTVVPSLNGEKTIFVDRFAVRLLTFLEGDILGNMKRSPELYRDIGCFLGQFSNAMQGFSHPGMEGSDPLWKLDNVLACKAYLPDVIDEDARDRITRLYEEYEKNIRPKLQNLRKAILHGDANEQNFLILPDQPDKIAGLIDFGEIQYGTQINDLAIALAYSLLGEDDIQMAANNIIDGYTREFPLEEAEIDILYHLMAMRLVTTITMTSHSAKQHPNNKYILISQKPARALLKKLEDENIINIH
jgi:Ser/Thr protein kinase RdoA (MazF antagonist)